MAKCKLFSSSQQILSPPCVKISEKENINPQQRFYGLNSAQNDAKDNTKALDRRHSKQFVFPPTYCLAMSDGKPKLRLVRNNKTPTISLTSLPPNKEGKSAEVISLEECRKKTTPKRTKVLHRRCYRSPSVKTQPRRKSFDRDLKVVHNSQSRGAKPLLGLIEKTMKEIDELHKRQEILHDKQNQKTPNVAQRKTKTSKNLITAESLSTEE